MRPRLIRPSRDGTGHPEIDRGVAGRSAMSEYGRRHANREERIRERWGRLAGLVLAMSEDPQSTGAWQRGSIGESKLATSLAKVERDDIIVLHDRKVPGTKGNIDHLVVCPAGVFVVDGKRYEGQVHTKDLGGLLTGSNLRLFVGRRDCTRLAIAMEWQVAAVKGALDVNRTPVRPVLCFIDAEWPLLGGPREFKGVLIESDRSLRRRITKAGEVDAEGVREVAMVLAHRFPACA
jgi:Nuclease-related domain